MLSRTNPWIAAAAGVLALGHVAAQAADSTAPTARHTPRVIFDYKSTEGANGAGQTERYRSFFFDPSKNGGGRNYWDDARFFHARNGRNWVDEAGANAKLELGGYDGYAQVFGMKSRPQDGAGINFYGTTDNGLHLGGDIEFMDSRPSPGRMDKLFGLKAGYSFDSALGNTTIVPGVHSLAGRWIGSLYAFHSFPDNWDAGIAYKFGFDGKSGDSFSAAFGRKSTETFRGLTWRVHGTTDLGRNHTVGGIAALGPHMIFNPVVFGWLNPTDGNADVSLLDNPMNMPANELKDKARRMALEVRHTASGGKEGFEAGAAVYPLGILKSDVMNTVNPFINLRYVKGRLYPGQSWAVGGGVEIDLSGRGLYRKTDASDSLFIGASALFPRGWMLTAGVNLGF